MRWERRGRSENLEDRRAEGGEAGSGLPGGFSGPRIGLPMARGGRRLSLTGLLVMLAVMWILGINPLTLLGGMRGEPFPSNAGAGPDVGIPGGFDGQGGHADAASDRSADGSGSPPPLDTTPDEEKQVDFVSFVLDDLQASWAKLVPGYQPAKLVLFRDATRSGCGLGQREMGPFYCPADQKVYVDLAFYDDLRNRFGAPGDFAEAYVLAHEIGHHVQALTGIEGQVRQEQRDRPDLANELSVRMELQADCLAGVWGHGAGTRDVLEAGDIEEGLRAASAIGDDRIQTMSGRGVQPESFTHGTSEQRRSWLQRGLSSGDPDDCDTFRS